MAMANGCTVTWVSATRKLNYCWATKKWLSRICTRNWSIPARRMLDLKQAFWHGETETLVTTCRLMVGLPLDCASTCVTCWCANRGEIFIYCPQSRLNGSGGEARSKWTVHRRILGWWVSL